MRPKSDGWFQAAVKRAKVQRIMPHSLCHTCASLAVSAGVNVLALQRMLGHTSAKMTLDTYADLFDDDLDAVAVSLLVLCGGITTANATLYLIDSVLTPPP